MNTTQHHTYMSLALRLAEQGRFTVSPNPMVGCVIVKHNRIIGQGFHQYCGQAHAEVLALKEAQAEAKDATAYVTLEPCCHQGKTPPCTSALIAAGIKKVYIACMDPNPLVAGKGIDELRSAGIDVEIGILHQQATTLNEIFFHYIQHKQPFVIAKWAMSLDGKTIVNDGDDKQISCLKSNQLTHQLRRQVDAIMVGANTARLDNPLLTARSDTTEIIKQPLRIILSGQQAFPDHLNLFSNKLPGKTLIVATQKTIHSIPPINHSRCEILLINENKHQKISLPDLMKKLGERGISSILVEGGMTLHRELMQENLINKMIVYLASILIGNLDKKKQITIQNINQIGSDFHIITQLKEQDHV